MDRFQAAEGKQLLTSMQGKGILGMKILAEGTLKKPEEQLKSLRFVLGLGCLDAMVIGFEKPEQIDQILQRVETVLQG